MTEASDHTLYTIRVVMKDQLGNNVFCYRSKEARDEVLMPLLKAHALAIHGVVNEAGYSSPITDAYGHVAQVDLRMVGMIYAGDSANFGRMQNDLQMAEMRRQIHLEKAFDRDQTLKGEYMAAMGRSQRRAQLMGAAMQGIANA